MENKEDEKRLTLWEHLEELRWTIFKILAVLGLFMALSMYFVDDILALIIAPSRPVLERMNAKLNLSGPFDAFFIKFKTGLFCGLVFAFPFIFYFLWKFAEPGLKEKEKSGFMSFLLWGTVLFNGGVAAGYFSIPFLISAASDFSVAGTENIWLLSDFISFITFWMIICGAICELPLLMFILTKIGILTPEGLKKGRPYAIVAIFVAAAVLTPPDPLSQIIVAIPLLILYEIGVFFAKFARPQKENCQ
jgi:sec-independent protein translocase protein TatC